MDPEHALASLHLRTSQDLTWLAGRREGFGQRAAAFVRAQFGGQRTHGTPRWSASRVFLIDELREQVFARAPDSGASRALLAGAIAASVSASHAAERVL